MKDVSFQNDGLKLDATILHPTKPGKHPAILFVHGWTSQRSRSLQYAEALVKLGYVCMLFDMRGHGTSEGDINTFTIKDFLSDVLAAYDYLANLPDVDSTNISAVGSSFGGFLVALLTSKRNIKNLVMRVPADYPNEDFDKTKATSSHENEETTTWRRKPKQYSETFALSALHHFSGRILIIEAEKDEVIPHTTIENYKNAVADKSQLTYALLKDAPHSMRDGKVKNQMEKMLTQWFQG